MTNNLSPLYGRGPLSPADKITRAKIQMMTRCPFTAHLLLKMKISQMPKVYADMMTASGMAPTMGVDRRGNLVYHDDFVTKLTDAQVMGVLRHEVLHVSFLDFDRMGHRDPMLSNICQDLVRNAQCKQDGFELPQGENGKGALIPDNNDSFTFQFQHGKSHTVTHIHTRAWEDIYEELYKVWPKDPPRRGGGKGNGPERPGKGNGKGNGKGKGDQQGKENGDGDGEEQGGQGTMPTDKNGKPVTRFDHHDLTGAPQTEQEAREHQQRIREMVAQAAQEAKSQGKLPTYLERLVDELMDAKVDWKTLLAQLVQQSIPSDFTWSMPAKRGIGCGLYLPRVLRETVEVMVAIDTSGSIGTDELRDFLSELRAILTSFPMVKAEVIVCDADVHDVHVLTTDTIDELTKLPYKGGGGTSHAPVMKFLKEERPHAKLLIGFTDGYSDINELEPPSCPVIWALTEHSVSPESLKWGHVIKLEK